MSLSNFISFIIAAGMITFFFYFSIIGHHIFTFLEAYLYCARYPPIFGVGRECLNVWVRMPVPSNEVNLLAPYKINDCTNEIRTSHI